MRRLFLTIIILPALAMAQTTHTMISVKGDSAIVRGRADADTNAVLVLYKTLRVKFIKGVHDTTVIFPGNVNFLGTVSGISGVTPTSYLDEKILISQAAIVNFTGSGVTASQNVDTLNVQINTGSVDSLTIVALGFVAGPHTTDTTLDSLGVVALGFVAGAHTTDTFVTNKDAHDHLGGDGAQIQHSSLGGIGASDHHVQTIDTFVTNKDAHDHLGGDGAQILHSSLGGIGASDHHVKTVDTTLDSLGVVALGFVAGPHTTDTTLDSLGVVALGFIAGAHTIDTFVTNKDAHDHLGGDGAQILHSSLGGIGASDHHVQTVDTQRSQEEIEDFAGAMVTTNTETRIVVTYDDVAGKFDFVVDNMNDDIPESGDFFNAVDLNADGSIAANAVTNAKTQEIKSSWVDSLGSAGIVTHAQYDTARGVIFTVALDSAAALIADTLFFTNPKFADVNIDSIQVESTLTGFAVTLVEANQHGGGIQTLDTVTASTSSVNRFYGIDTVQLHTLVEKNHDFGIVRPTNTSKFASITVFGWWLR